MKRKQSVTDTIREAVKSVGASHRSIAAKAGISPSVLCRFVNGKRGLRMAAIDALCEVLGLGLFLSQKGNERN
jgi:transcriptional regulator with XRE-family HTH domain